MFKDLLEYLVKKGVYVEISGMTSPGTEKILLRGNLEETYVLGNKVIFLPDMVQKILFHEKGCTIYLKH